jgi:opacity protein-like surface antigen
VAKTRAISLLAAAATTVCLSSPPAVADDTGFYVGANVGHVLRTYSLTDIDNGLSAAFATSGNSVVLSSSSLRKDHVMWTADVGYMASRNFGIEASYLHLGSLAYSTSGTESAGGAGTAVSVNLDIKSRGPALAAVAVLPMSNWWTIDGRVGAYEGKTISTHTTTIDGNSISGAQSKTSTSLLAGAGTAFTVSSHCTLRADYIRLESVKEATLGRSFNVDLVTAGVVFVF